VCTQLRYLGLENRSAMAKSGKKTCFDENRNLSLRCGSPNAKTLGWGTTPSKTRNMPKKSRAAREQPSLGPSPSINAPVTGSLAWAAQLHAIMQQHAWAADVQIGGVARHFAAHQALLVALRTQQAGAAGGGAAAAVGGGGSGANEAPSFGTAVDQGHKSLAEMRQERQVHPNLESVFSIQT